MTYWFVVDVAPMIAYPLSHIINLSIIRGCVQDELIPLEKSLFSRKMTKLKSVIIALFQF